jgi:hypothetical protein
MYKVVLLLKDTLTDKQKKTTKAFLTLQDNLTFLRSTPDHKRDCEVLKYMFTETHYGAAYYLYNLFYPEADGEFPLSDDRDRFKLLKLDIYCNEKLILSEDYSKGKRKKVIRKTELKKRKGKP